ncbi:MAG: hypothetical protein ABW157_00270 [Candidatus Thiodiazotropha sp. LLP2]
MSKPEQQKSLADSTQTQQRLNQQQYSVMLTPVRQAAPFRD